MLSSEVLRIISTVSVLLPIALSLVRFRAMAAQYPNMLAYLLVTGLVEGWGLVQIYLGAMNTLLVYNLYTLFEFGLLSFLFYRPFNSRPLQGIIMLLNATFLPFALYRLFQNPSGHDGLVLAVENILLLFLALLFFYRLLRNLDITDLTRYPMFWFSTGILVFFAGTFFIFLFSNYIVTPKNFPALGDLWNIPRYLNMVFHAALATGIWYCR